MPVRAQENILRVLAAFFLSASVLYGAGPLVPALRPLFGQLPFAVNAGAKVGLMGLLCLYASGDRARRPNLILVVIVAHVLSVSSTLGFLGTADVSGSVQLGSLVVGRVTALWSSVVLDSGIIVLALALYLSSRPQGKPPDWLWPPVPLERWLRVTLVMAGSFFAVAAVAYQLAPVGPSRASFVELPFVGMSVVKYATMAILCLHVARGTGGRLPLANLVIVAHLLSAFFAGLLLAFGDTRAVLAVAGFSMPVTRILLGQIGIDGGFAVFLWWLCRGVWRARFQVEFFTPGHFRTLLHVARVVVVGQGEAIPHWSIARNTEQYLRQVRARRRWTQQFALAALELHPLLYLKPPLSELDAGQCLAHLKQHFFLEGLAGALPDWWRRVVQVLIRITKQLVYVGYYSDPRTWPGVGYVPFSRRPRAQALPPAGAAPRLEVLRPRDISHDVLDADVCVVGSGAAGATLAYHLAKAGRAVLVIERGRYIVPRRSPPPGEQGFTEDEVEMVGRLYADGVFQQTEDWRFTVLQGSCVGGTTVVNNAVCFAPPERVLARWNDPAGLDAGLDLARLRGSVGAVQSALSIGSQAGAMLNPSGRDFVKGATDLGITPGAFEVDAVRANIRDCLGCGYCNIGCAFDRKLSMLDTVLPWAQRDFPGRVRILAECEVERILTRSGSPAHAVAIRAGLPDGRKVTVRAKTFVLSAGAVASSYLLLQSGVGRRLPVGRRVSFNMGSPITAEFDRVLNAYDGLQISHYALPSDDRGYVLETWWNPPVTQALSMPGWFEEHFENMRCYPRLMGVGVLVGTQANASIRRALTGGPGIVFVPRGEDLHKLAAGLTQAAEIAFAAGAKRVMLNTWGSDVFHSPADLRNLDRLVDPGYITLGTGHPQGGNAISRSPAQGVVGPDFRVHGFDNLFICDASVFPSSLTVNPQLTVMALAHYAAPQIAAA